ncbi:antitoxin [Planktothrix agardhii]|jgi:antitoxin VapB|uniref:VapB n=2 Tax=Planktothrix agardhii TaxID=1160 RepID=A0A073CII0_PLAA1|nr:type II toxin-antitoxin system VapB family antitoxin [Planktothrix agardhii]BBD56469.1 similar to virulence-associated protein VapB [Planktothrix agardhii NIES-204]KEI67722.1 VapB [Planktothrix agardhii NIVA-CYA 126/8]MCB8759452.1 type II toxin-antitoxin system VapB family antitoxin [Planktothrix agardhii 1813]MCB8764798.1 type II toxin-antitoxin system VapB family antitoxin [Planktothrix agardhii 1809]MCB8778436.1 type II toxin-antitoxin system VapB family antitoxin [Planktothrix agardhii 
MDTAKLLKNSNEQTLVLPEEYQFSGDEVYLKKIGNVLILIPKDNPWQSLFESLNLFSEDFMESREQPALEIREEF